MTVTLVWGASTHVGLVREANEDAVLTAPPLFAVADGMGGHAAGDLASQLAIGCLMRLPALPRAGGDVLGALHEANRVILATAGADPAREGMGTTITVLELSNTDGEAELYNVGDSRAYRFRGHRLVQLSDDHSIVADMIRAGELSVSEARRHPDRHVITRAIGMTDELVVDHWDLLCRGGDRYLLCSDGLTSEVGESVVASILDSGLDPQATAERLVVEALQGGGRDNVSVVVVDVNSVGFDDEATTPRAEDGGQP